MLLSPTPPDAVSTDILWRPGPSTCLLSVYRVPVYTTTCSSGASSTTTLDKRSLAPTVQRVGLLAVSTVVAPPKFLCSKMVTRPPSFTLTPVTVSWAIPTSGDDAYRPALSQT